MNRGPAHARDAAPHVAYRPPTPPRDGGQAILESTLPHAVMRDLLDPVRPDEAQVDALAEQLERHAPAGDAHPHACRRTALELLDRRSSVKHTGDVV